MSSATSHYVGPDTDPDKYRLLQQVGSGGEAQLWQAELALAGEWEPVAVKVLRPDRLAGIDGWRARWGEQAELLRFLHHPGVVGVREHFDGSVLHLAGGASTATSERSLYLVMNWVDGPSMREWAPLHRAAEDHFTALRHLTQVADVLDWLHSGEGTPSKRPIVHGDVTPSNVILTEVGQAVLVDFGLARVAGLDASTVEGTRGYMAPEVVAGGTFGPASDRYAFGGLMYFTLTGQDPPEDVAAIRAALAQLPMTLGQEGMLDHLMVMFSGDPSARPGAGEWIRQLRLSTSTATAMAAGWSAPAATAAVALPAATRRRRKRWPLAVAAAVVVAGSAAGAVALTGGGDDDDPASAPVRRTTTTTAPTTTTTDAVTTTTTSTTVTLQSPEYSAQYLDEMEPVSGRIESTGQAKANAKQYLHALTLATVYDGQTAVEFDVSRSWERLTVEIGARDDNDSSVLAAYAIYLDGVKAASGEVALGTTTPVSLDLTDVLRLRLEMTGLRGDGSASYWVWGDAQVSR